MNDNDKMQKARCVTKEDADLGFRIRKIRQDKRISQKEVAKKCGICDRQLRKYELGHNRISVQRLLQIADILDVDVGSLLNPANDKKPPVPLKNQSLQNIDRTAARLWSTIQNDRHKYAILELMDILHRQQKTGPLGVQKRD